MGNAIKFFLCIVCPPIAVLLTRRAGSFLISLVLTLLGWLPGVIHAFFVVLDENAQRRHEELLRAASGGRA